MANRSNDLLFIFSGGIPFSQSLAVDADFDIQPYFKINAGRRLLMASRGADNDIDGNVQTVMAMIREFTGGRTDTI
ncbi:MAG: hypothetical protein ABI557_19085, partial [Aureliella sp.]